MRGRSKKATAIGLGPTTDLQSCVLQPTKSLSSWQPTALIYYTTARRWRNNSGHRRENKHILDWVDPKMAATTETSINKLKQLMAENRYFSLSELEQELNIAYESFVRSISVDVL